MQLLDLNESQTIADMFLVSSKLLGQLEPLFGIRKHFFFLKKDCDVENRNEKLRLPLQSLFVAIYSQ